MVGESSSSLFLPPTLTAPAPQLHEAGFEFHVYLSQVLPALVDRLLGRQRGSQLWGHDGRGGRLIRLILEDSFIKFVVEAAILTFPELYIFWATRNITNIKAMYP